MLYTPSSGNATDHLFGTYIHTFAHPHRTRHFSLRSARHIHPLHRDHHHHHHSTSTWCLLLIWVPDTQCVGGGQTDAGLPPPLNWNKTIPVCGCEVNFMELFRTIKYATASDICGTPIWKEMIILCTVVTVNASSSCVRNCPWHESIHTLNISNIVCWQILKFNITYWNTNRNNFRLIN